MIMPPAAGGRADVNVDVLIVGAGPAGLAAAIELRRLGVGQVLVADREQQPGGVPRHSAHTGYGLRDLRRVLTGPAYARHYVEAAVSAGVRLRPATTVTGLDAAARLATLTSPDGIETVTARAVLLATGCRERPRAARLIPGDRPSGVLTTGELQQRVHAGSQSQPGQSQPGQSQPGQSQPGQSQPGQPLPGQSQPGQSQPGQSQAGQPLPGQPLPGQPLSGRALIVGAEHVSFSAMVTLAQAGADVVALVTEQPRQQSYAVFALAASVRWRVPVWTSTAVRRIVGRGSLAGVELADVRTGATRFVECRTLVFTGDWIPDHELARLAGVAIDPGTRGPAVDTGGQTSVSHIFAAGNLVHPAETADVAALGGRHAARQIAAALDGAAPRRPLAAAVPVTVEAPLTWISPSVIRNAATPPPRGVFLLRAGKFARRARLEVRQGDKVLARAGARLIPGRPVRLGADWLAGVEPSAGPVLVRLR
jgi:thioredoxin reductase